MQDLSVSGSGTSEPTPVASQVQVPATAPSAVLVEGMHASGTSLLSHLIARVLRARPSTPSPDVDLVTNQVIGGLHRRIQQDLGSEWSKPALLFLRGKGIADSRPLIRERVRERYREQVLGVLRNNADGGPLILEDPNLCLLHDLWETVLRETGYRPRTVLVFRNPLEVAASLKQSHGLPNSRTLQLWVHYNLAALSAPRDGQAPLVIAYHDVMDPAGDLATRLAALFDTPLSPSDADAIRADWQNLVQETAREATVPEQVIARSPVVPGLVKRLYQLLLEWDTTEDQHREAALRNLAADFEDQSLFAGNLVQVQMPQASPSPPPAGKGMGDGATHKLLIHYHLFKNAGTSVDAILRRNFGNRWINTEFPPRSQEDHQAAIRRFIADDPHLAAISSHTLMLPVPRIEGVEILPILFVRHPLDRMRSAYEFERRQDATTVGSRLARENDLAGYIRARLAIPGDRACRDFQVARLAMALPASEGSEAERALAAAERLPFVGLVEAFQDSVQRLRQLVRPMFSNFQCFDAWENSTKGRQRTLEQRLADIREELGEECFAMVIKANKGDVTLYETVQCGFGPQANSTGQQALQTATAVV
jgi:hypothetical protein